LANQVPFLKRIAQNQIKKRIFDQLHVMNFYKPRIAAIFTNIMEITSTGANTLSAAQFSAISPIAHQCILEGGNAVALARTLYHLNDPKRFDDVDLCGLIVNREAPKAKAAMPQTLQVNPNPSSHIAQNILTWYGGHYPPAYTLYASEERDNKPAGSTNGVDWKVIVIPNPSTGPITLRFIVPNAAQSASLRVSDVNGRLVQGFDTLSSNGEVNMTFMAPGMYFYQLMANGRLLESGKIVIQH
jgi:Secretion system C-terminal sorting domain